MAIITDTGILSTSLNDYKEALEDIFKIRLGEDLDIDPQTPQGQIIGIIALFLSEGDDSVVQAFQNLNIFNASGNQLDAYGAIFEIIRKSAFNSFVNVNLTGVASTIVPAGSRAKTINGDIFELLTDIILDGAGLGVGIFTATESGAIIIEANTLITIIDVVIGWETIDNPADGIIGETKEEDIKYRQDYFNLINKNSLATVDSIASNILTLTDVINVKVSENDTSSNLVKQLITLLPHSIACVVNGGIAQEIGQKLYDVKTVGANTAGDNLTIQTAVNVTSQGGTTPAVVYYYPVEFVTVTIIVTITQYNIIPDVVNQIQDAVVKYFNGTFSSEIPAIDIADTLFKSRLFTPINSVAGFEINSLTMDIGSGDADFFVPNLNQQLIISEEDITVVLN